MSTKALEIETGVATNEPVNYAIRTTIEHAVHNMIYEGIECEFWSFKIEE
jgi:curli production assembly/transport component CsgG